MEGRCYEMRSICTVGPDATWVPFAAVSTRERAKFFAETCEMNVQIWFVEYGPGGEQTISEFLELVDNDETAANERRKRISELETSIAKVEEELCVKRKFLHILTAGGK